jgi:hypothetical protein
VQVNGLPFIKINYKVETNSGGMNYLVFSTLLSFFFYWRRSEIRGAGNGYSMKKRKLV